MLRKTENRKPKTARVITNNFIWKQVTRLHSTGSLVAAMFPLVKHSAWHSNIPYIFLKNVFVPYCSSSLTEALGIIWIAYEKFQEGCTRLQMLKICNNLLRKFVTTPKSFKSGAALLKCIENLKLKTKQEIHAKGCYRWPRWPWSWVEPANRLDFPRYSILWCALAE